MIKQTAISNAKKIKAADIRKKTAIGALNQPSNIGRDNRISRLLTVEKRALTVSQNLNGFIELFSNSYGVYVSIRFALKTYSSVDRYDNALKKYSNC